MADQADPDARPINMRAIDALARFVVPHDSVSTALNILVPRIVRNGVRFSAQLIGAEGTTRAEAELSVMREGAEQALENEWRVAAARIITDLLCYGLCVIVPRKSSVLPEFEVPEALPLALVSVLQRFDIEEMRTEYTARWRNVPTASTAHEYLNTEIEGSRVLVLYPPHQLRGSPTSPVAMVAPQVMMLRKLMADIEYASHWAARPVYALSSDPAVEAAAAQASRGGPVFALRELASEAASERGAAAAALRNEAHRDAIAARERRQKDVIDAQARHLHAAHNGISREDAEALSDLAGMEHDALPPYLNQYPMGPGQELRGAPTPGTLGGVNLLIADLRKSIMTVIGVSPQLASVERANFAANSELAFAVTNDAVQGYQSSMETVLAEAFEHVNAGHIRMLADSSTAEPESADGTPDDARKRKRVTQHSAAASRHVRILAKLRTTPITDFATLERALRMRVIDHETFKRHVVNLIGLHGDDMDQRPLTDSELEALMFGPSDKPADNEPAKKRAATVASDE